VLSSLAGAGGGGAPGPVMPSEAGELPQPANPSAASRMRVRIMVPPDACVVRSVVVAEDYAPQVAVHETAASDSALRELAGVAPHARRPVAVACARPGAAVEHVRLLAAVEAYAPPQVALSGPPEAEAPYASAAHAHPPAVPPAGQSSPAARV
jgi:hypothetical protein